MAGSTSTPRADPDGSPGTSEPVSAGVVRAAAALKGQSIPGYGVPISTVGRTRRAWATSWSANRARSTRVTRDLLGPARDACRQPLCNLVHSDTENSVHESRSSLPNARSQPQVGVRRVPASDEQVAAARLRQIPTSLGGAYHPRSDPRCDATHEFLRLATFRAPAWLAEAIPRSESAIRR